VLAALLIAVCLSFAGVAVAAGDANSAECTATTVSSPGFRTYLPNCSAWEMVTPPYIGGGFVGGLTTGELPVISAKGEHVLGMVFAGFAGTEDLEQAVGLHDGAIYEFSRSAGGWTAEALDPPASVYPRRQFVFMSSDLSHSLWAVQVPPAPGEELPPGGLHQEDNSTLVLREAAGGGKGRFTVVGPVAAPGHEVYKPAGPFTVRGASGDLSHILLSVTAVAKQLWPGDATFEEGGSSLYEYEGTGEREPVLVGVKNDGSVAAAAAAEHKVHVNEAAELVSRCGITPGASEHEGPLSDSVSSLDNAISTNGQVVFFTALACAGGPAVNELYARVDGAQTVDISEPTAGVSGDCGTCEESEPRPAVFVGASQDGSKVFFYSEQELLPDAAGINLYEYDFDAANPHERLTLVAPGVQSVAALSADGSHIYFESPVVLTEAADGNGEVARAGAQNLYGYDANTGSVTFVADEASDVRTTNDGQYVVFESPRQVAGTDDTSGVSQIFEYDASSGLISRVSIGADAPGGSECEVTHRIEGRYSCDGNTDADTPGLPDDTTRGDGAVFEPTEATSHRAVSAGGAVEFQSTDALTPGATLGGRNVYEYQAGEVYLISSGNEPIPFERLGGETRMLGISESGANVFFSSPLRLLPQDIDSQNTWYDARENGGFPAPLSQVACQGEECQGATRVPPHLPGTPGSVTTPGSGNQPPQAPAGPPRLTNAQKLKKALTSCRKYRAKGKRSSCERQARKHYVTAARNSTNPQAPPTK
jgi:hypothetical protein